MELEKVLKDEGLFLVYELGRCLCESCVPWWCSGRSYKKRKICWSILEVQSVVLREFYTDPCVVYVYNHKGVYRTIFSFVEIMVPNPVGSKQSTTQHLFGYYHAVCDLVRLTEIYRRDLLLFVRNEILRKLLLSLWLKITRELRHGP